jgi:hypothetical protein
MATAYAYGFWLTAAAVGATCRARPISYRSPVALPHDRRLHWPVEDMVVVSARCTTRWRTDSPIHLRMSIISEPESPQACSRHAQPVRIILSIVSAPLVNTNDSRDHARLLDQATGWKLRN